MVKVAVVPHCPASGIKVQVVVRVLSIAGDHEPVILLFEVVGKAAMLLPKQKGPIAVNVGVILWSIEMVIVVTSPH